MVSWVVGLGCEEFGVGFLGCRDGRLFGARLRRPSWEINFSIRETTGSYGF